MTGEWAFVIGVLYGIGLFVYLALLVRRYRTVTARMALTSGTRRALPDGVIEGECRIVEGGDERK